MRLTRWRWWVLAGLVAGCHGVRAEALPSAFVIAPVVEGLFECGEGPPLAGSHCARSHGNAAAALEQVLEELEPGGARGAVQVGYVLTVQALGLFKAQGNAWVIDDKRISRVLELLRTVDRPVVVYFAANHFDSQSPLATALSRDPSNLMVLADGKPPGSDYFGYAIQPWTLRTDPRVPVNRYRFQALQHLVGRLAAEPPAVRSRIVGLALGGEIHHLFPDFSEGMGVFDHARTTDYGAASVADFRAWLARRYGSVEKLNAALGGTWKRFEDVRPPHRTAAPDAPVPRLEHYDGYAAGKLALHGWLWDPQRRVRALELWVEGKLHGEIARGFNRLDVYRKVAEVTDPNVGFRYDLDYTAWPPGDYRLEVVARSDAGHHPIGERRVLVEGLPRSRWARAWDRLKARVRFVLRRATRPLPGARSSLDMPRNDVRVLFNPLARDWNAFRAEQVRSFMAELHARALAAGLAGDKLYSHQILPRVNSSWNHELFATDGSVGTDLPWRQGFNTYGGAANGPWTRGLVATQRMTGYGVPEFHPQQWKRAQAHLEGLEQHRALGARFVSPYYVSIASDPGASGSTAIKALEIRPNNPKEGSDMLYQAIRRLAAE